MVYYRPKRNAQNEALTAKIKDIAATRVHYGYRRITARLRLDGLRLNPKRVFRLYRLAELGLRRRRPRRRRSQSSAASGSSRRGPTRYGAWTSSMTGLPMAGRSGFS